MLGEPVEGVGAPARHKASELAADAVGTEATLSYVSNHGALLGERIGAVRPQIGLRGHGGVSRLSGRRA